MSDFGDLGQATAAVQDPTTTAADLAAIVSAQPTLWADVARHPNAYADLLVWLDEAGDETVRQAVASRRPVVPSAGPTAVPQPVAPPAAPASPDFMAPAPSAVPAQPSGYQLDPYAAGVAQPGPYPAPSAPTAPAAKKSKKGLIIGLTCGVLVIALALVGIFVVRPMLSGGTTQGSAPDLATAPAAGASLSLMAGMSSDYTDYYHAYLVDPGVAGLGLGYVNVDYSTFNSDHNRGGWYQGYDEDYAKGYTDGLACAKVPAPPSSDTWGYFTWQYLLGYYCVDYLKPPVGDPDLWGDSNHQGYSDGFKDGLNGTQGANQVAAPETLDQSTELIGFHPADGTVAWTFDLSTTGVTEAGMTTLADYSATDDANGLVASNGSGKIAFVVCPDGVPSTKADAKSVLVILDAGTGALTSQTTFDQGWVSVAGYVGSTVLVSQETFDANTQKPTSLTIYAVSDAGAIQWQRSTPLGGVLLSASTPVIQDKWVFGGKSYLTIADGKPASFGSDANATTSYRQTADGSVFRLSAPAVGPGSVELTKWNPGQNVADWTNPVELTSSDDVSVTGKVVYAVTDQGVAAFTLGTGQQRWIANGVPIGASVGPVVGRYLVITRTNGTNTGGNEITLIDTKTQQLTPIPADSEGFYYGAKTVYLMADGGLVAYDASADQPVKLWSLADDGIFSVIDRQFVSLADDGTVTVYH